ncbi:MAG: crotonase/enoyl-CoA hydratase family protein [Burkholderiaceae bacterium]|nr:crotonase/enoyl-CoA hydratase family protein [Burkholderiaceae bacterium]
MLMTTEITDIAPRLANPSSLWPRRQLQQVDVAYDPALQTLWTYMKPIGVPCFNQDMLEELYFGAGELQRHQGKHAHGDAWVAVDFSVIASRRPGIFSLGGDLKLFLNLIRERDREGLLNYAMSCIDSLFIRISGYDASIITISLVQGDALGGGLEIALSSDIVVAEAGSRMGLPEILFNLCPGMGAYSFLARRIGLRKAEELILSGNIYTAEQCLDMGIVDVLAPAGEGERVVNELIQKRRRHLNGARAIYQWRQQAWPVTHQELTNIALSWVDAALRLEEKDLKMMSRLLAAQCAQHVRERKSRHNDSVADLLAA